MAITEQEQRVLRYIEEHLQRGMFVDGQLNMFSGDKTIPAIDLSRLSREDIDHLIKSSKPTVSSASSLMFGVGRAGVDGKTLRLMHPAKKNGAHAYFPIPEDLLKERTFAYLIAMSPDKKLSFRFNYDSDAEIKKPLARVQGDFTLEMRLGIGHGSLSTKEEMIVYSGSFRVNTPGKETLTNKSGTYEQAAGTLGEQIARAFFRQIFRGRSHKLTFVDEATQEKTQITPASSAVQTPAVTARITPASTTIASPEELSTARQYAELLSSYARSSTPSSDHYAPASAATSSAAPVAPLYYESNQTSQETPSEPCSALAAESAESNSSIDPHTLLTKTFSTLCVSALERKPE